MIKRCHERPAGRPAMIVVEKVLFLSHIPIFAGMPNRELAHLAGVAEETTVAAGETILRQNDYGDALFLVVEGEVAIKRDDREVARVGPQGYFGEMSILDDESRSATVVATTHSLLLRIKRDDFLEVVTTYPDAARAVIRTLSRRIRSMMETSAGSRG